MSPTALRCASPAVFQAQCPSSQLKTKIQRKMTIQPDKSTRVNCGGCLFTTPCSLRTLVDSFTWSPTSWGQLMTPGSVALVPHGPKRIATGAVHFLHCEKLANLGSRTWPFGNHPKLPFCLPNTIFQVARERRRCGVGGGLEWWAGGKPSGQGVSKSRNCVVKN